MKRYKKGNLSKARAANRLHSIVRRVVLADNPIIDDLPGASK